MSDENDVSAKLLLRSIVNFKRAYYAMLPESDRTRIKLWIHKLQDLDGVPQENGHYVNCPWSLPPEADVDGPDTCGCNVPALIKWKFDRLLAEYRIFML